MKNNLTYLLFAPVLALGCSKGGSTRTTAGDGALLSKEVLVYKNADASSLDSVTTMLAYNTDNTPSQFEQYTYSLFSGGTTTADLTYNFTYSGGLIAGFTGMVKQVASASTLFTQTTMLSTTFHSTAGKVDGYIQTASVSGAAFFPETPETGNDSALITYDASGNISTYTIYQEARGATTYVLLTQTTFTFAGGNLVQSVTQEYVGGVAEGTVTTIYTYNTHLSATPLYIIPGVATKITNDVSAMSETTTGVNAGSVAVTFTSTYNTADQPVISSGPVTITPVTSAAFTQESISYEYE